MRANDTTTESPRPNFRLFDRTGDFLQYEDVYAESLPGAIAAGRAMLRNGSWADEARPFMATGEVARIVYGDDGEIDKELTAEAIEGDCSVWIEVTSAATEGN